MAEIEYQRIQNLSKNEAETYPALHLFDGLMYRNIKRKDWTQEENSYIQEHLLLTSSLYGVIPALNPIAPHRTFWWGWSQMVKRWKNFGGTIIQKQ